MVGKYPLFELCVITCVFRIRRERDHHKERSGNLEEIERTCNHYQQMAVGQQAMLENLQKVRIFSHGLCFLGNAHLVLTTNSNM